MTSTLRCAFARLVMLFALVLTALPALAQDVDSQRTFTFDDYVIRTIEVAPLTDVRDRGVRFIGDAEATLTDDTRLFLKVRVAVRKRRGDAVYTFRPASRRANPRASLRLIVGGDPETLVAQRGSVIFKRTAGSKRRVERLDRQTLASVETPGDYDVSDSLQRLADGVVVVTPAQFGQLVIDGDTYSFTSPSAQLAAVEPGGILLSREDPAFLRVVRAVDESSDYRVVLQTDRASLLDAFESATVEELAPVGDERLLFAPGVAVKSMDGPGAAKRGLGARSGKTAAEDLLPFDTFLLDVEKELYRAGDSHVTVSGDLAVAPAFVLEVDVEEGVNEGTGPPQVNSVNVRGVVEVTGSLAATAELAASDILNEGQAIQRGRTLFQKSKVFVAGYLVGRVTLEAILSVEAELEGHARVAADVEGSAEIGATYDGAIWSPVNENTFSYTSDVEVGVAGDLNVAVTLVFTLEVYDSADVVVEATPSVALHGEFNSDTGELCYSVTAGLQAAVDIGVSFLDESVVDYSNPELIDFEIVLVDDCMQAYEMPPAPPRGFAARPDPAGVALQWLDVADDETGYEIQSRAPQDVDWQALALTAANVTAFLDTTADPGTTYEYRIRAVSDAALSAFGTIAAAAPESIDDFGDFADSAQAVALPAVLDGVLEDNGDADVFSIVPSNDGVYSARTFGTTDTLIVVLDSTGFPLGLSDDRAPDDLNAEVRVALAAGLRYYVVVVGFRAEELGDYQIVIRAAPVGTIAQAPVVLAKTENLVPIASQILAGQLTALEMFALVTDADGDAWTLSWLLDGVPFVPDGHLKDGASSVASTLVALAGSGTYTVSCFATDVQGNVSNTVEWQVVVTEVVAQLGETKLTVSAVPRTVPIGDPTRIVALLRDLSPPFPALAGQEITLTVDGTEVGTVATDGNGKATFTFTPPSAKPGKGPANVTAAFAGDGTFLESIGVETLTVIDRPLIPSTLGLSIAPTAVAPGDLATLTIRLTENSFGSPLLGSRPLTVKVDGATIASPKTPKSGALIVAHKPQSEGEETVTVTFGGDATHATTETTGTLAVVRIETTTSLSLSTNSIETGMPVTLRADLKTAGTGGLPIRTQTIDFQVAGESVGKATTTKSGRATFVYRPTAAGNHTVTAVYAGDTRLQSSSAAATLSVNGIPTALALTFSQATATPLDTVTLTARIVSTGSGPGPLSGKGVEFTVDGTSIDSDTTDAQGQASVDYSPSALGSRSIKARFAGDNVHEASSASRTLEVAKHETVITLTLSDSSVAPDDEITVTARLARDGDIPGPAIEGKTVVITVDGETEHTGTSNSMGIVTFDYTPDSASNRTVKAEFAGDAGHAGSDAKKTLTVTKLGTTLTLALSTVAIAPDETTTFTATLTESGLLGDDIAGRAVNFKVDGATVKTDRTGSDGKIAYTYTPTGVGTFSVKVEFAGDYRYTSADSQTRTLTVAKVGTTLTLTLSSVAIAPDETTTFTATLTESGPFGDDIAGRTVNFKVDDATVKTDTTGSDGQVAYTYTPTGVGTFSVKIEFAGDVHYESAASQTRTLTVAKVGTTLTLTLSSVAIAPDETTTFTATLVESGPLGDNIAGRTVNFKVDDATVKTDTTGSDGQVAYTYTPTGVGTFSVKIEFAGDVHYESAASQTRTLTVAKVGTTLTLALSSVAIAPDETTTFTATLVESGLLGDDIAGRTVNFKVDDATVKSDTTGSDGKVAYTYTPTGAGTFSVKVEFAGDVHYETAASQARTLTVAKVGTTLTLALSSVAIAPDETTTFTATLTESGPLGGDIASQTVSFKVDGATVKTDTTGSNGKVAYTYTPTGAGTFSVKVEFAGDVHYESAASQARTLTVTKRTTRIVVAPSPLIVELGGASTLTATLEHGIAQLTALAGETVVIKVAGSQVASGTTDSSGQLSFAYTPLDLTDRAVTAEYAGDSVYLSATSPSVTLRTRDTTAPSVPSLTSPTAGASLSDTTPTFTWSASTDTGGIKEYDIQVHRKGPTGNYNILVTNVTVTSATYTPSSGYISGSFKWQVRAVDQSNNKSAFASERFFTIE